MHTTYLMFLLWRIPCSNLRQICCYVFKTDEQTWTLYCQVWKWVCRKLLPTLCCACRSKTENSKSKSKRTPRSRWDSRNHFYILVRKLANASPQKILKMPLKIHTQTWILSMDPVDSQFHLHKFNSLDAYGVTPIWCILRLCSTYLYLVMGLITLQCNVCCIPHQNWGNPVRRHHLAIWTYHREIICFHDRFTTWISLSKELAIMLTCQWLKHIALFLLTPDRQINEVTIFPELNSSGKSKNLIKMHNFFHMQFLWRAAVCISVPLSCTCIH